MQTVLRKRPIANMRDDKRKVPPWSQVIPLALVFALSLCLRLWFNFGAEHINNYSSCDASEYLRNADALINLRTLPAKTWLDCLSSLAGTATGSTVLEVRQSLSSLNDFKISGPVFPFFLAICSAIAGGAFSERMWIVALAAQSLLSACTCLFIAFIGASAFDKRTGFMAGILSAFYPAFIVNSGRLYSETFAVFLFSLLTWLTVRSLRQRGNSLPLVVLTGFTMACLQLSRSIMVVISFLLAPIHIFQNKGRTILSSTLALAFGFALAAVPWLALQKVVFGSGSLMVDRVGHFNFFIGNNVDTAGFLSYPYPDGTAVESKSITTLAKEAIEKSPERWVKLLLDKPARFLKFPWNDFKCPIGPVTASQQILFHQLILLLFVPGIVLGFALKTNSKERDYRSDRDRENERFQARMLLALGILFHALYLLFITVPRYNLTVMPLLIVFAAGCLTCLLHLLQNHRSIPAAIAIIASSILLIFSQQIELPPLLALLTGPGHPILCLSLACLLKALVLCLFMVSLGKAIPPAEGHPRLALGTTVALTLVLLPVLCLPVNANGRWWEWRCPLAARQNISQTVTLDSAQADDLTGRQAFVLLDTTFAPDINNELAVRVNGQRLKGPVVPGLSLVGDFTHFMPIAGNWFAREGEYIFDCMTRSAGIANCDLRQWFLVPLPDSALCHQPGKPLSLTIEIAATGDNMHPNSVFGALDTGGNQMIIPGLTLASWEKPFYGVDCTDGFGDTRYEIKLPSACSKLQTGDLSPQPGLQSGRYNIHVLSAARQTSTTPSNIYTVEQNSPALSGKKTWKLDLSSLDSRVQKQRVISLRDLPAYSPTEFWLVRLTGKVRSLSGMPVPGLRFSAEVQGRDGKESSYISPWTPRRLEVTSAWRDFDITVPLAPGALPGAIKGIEYSFFARSPSLDSINPPLQRDGLVEFADTSLQILSLPANPLADGHKVY